jgi:four helix bundle protein
MKTHHDLKVWVKSVEFVDTIYDIIDTFPYSENKALSYQLRRAAISVPSNIAEGAARHYKKEFIQYLYHAFGSLSEIETQLIIAKNRKYILDLSATMEDLNEIQRMLHGLINYLKNKQ